MDVPWEARSLSGPRIEIFPMPFNASTRIRVSLPRSGAYVLTVLNLLGEVVGEICDGPMPSGVGEFTFNAGGLPTGVYCCALRGEGMITVRRMVLVR